MHKCSYQKAVHGLKVCVCVCVPMPTHCTIMRFGFHTRRIVWSIFKSRTAWAYNIMWRTSICIVYWRKLRLGWLSVTVCVVLLCCVGWWWKEGRRWNPVPPHSLLFSKSTKRAARLNVPIRRMNRYQQYYMPSQHTYCGRVWNLIQDCDVQSSD